MQQNIIEEFCRKNGFENGQERYEGTLDLYNCNLPKGLVLPKELRGLELRNCTLPEGLVLPKELGWLQLWCYTLPEWLILPKEVGTLYLYNCTVPDSLRHEIDRLQEMSDLDFYESENFVKADGIFAKILSKKGNVWHCRELGKKESMYLVTDGQGNYAHGKTIKEAKADLIYKISDRDTSMYVGIDVHVKHPFKDCIAMYKAITGACFEGMKGFIEGNNIAKKKYSVLDIAKLTEGQYRNNEFKQFFNLK